MLIPIFRSRRPVGGAGFSAASLCALSFALSPPAATLTLLEAEQLALASPPAVLAADARMRALHAQADAARALPPPQLIVGFEDVPVEGSGAWGLPPGGDGMAVAGVMQIFPSGRQRELQRARLQSEAEVARAMARGGVRATQLAVRLAYIDFWYTAQARELAQDTTQEIRKRLGSTAAAYRNGRTTLADRDGAGIDLALAHDSLVAWQQQHDDAAIRLARWIGVIDDKLDVQAPALPETPSEDVLFAALTMHPDLQTVQRALNTRQIEVDRARASRHPDWRLEARYGWRGGMPDTASVMLGVDLPWASGGRQRQQIAGALQGVEEGEAMREERLREMRSAIAAAYRQHAHLRERLAAFDDGTVAVARRRADASLAGYRHGRDPFDSVVSARIAALDIAQKRLSLQAECLRVQAQLLYFAPEPAREP